MKKKERHPSMRIYLTLLMVVEFGLMVILAQILEALLHRYFRITVEVPSMVWGLAICIFLGGVVTSFIGKGIFKPIIRLGEAMRQVAKGDFGIRLKAEHRFKEIEDIYSNFNLMVDELAATEILQNDFVSNVSHEFKTPINAIEGYATLLQDADSSGNEQQQIYVEKILLNTRRLSHLVGNILLLSKVDNQSIPGKHTSFRLDEQIRQSILLLESEWTKKEIEFDVEMESIDYTGNETLLIHVWNNLIGNAIKFDPKGGFVRIHLHRMGEEIHFIVEDNGPGISPEAEKHIFDRFYQSDSSHKEEGNGLGLALVKQILTLHNGSVKVDNLPEGGCRFTVILP